MIVTSRAARKTARHSASIMTAILPFDRPGEIGSSFFSSPSACCVSADAPFSSSEAGLAMSSLDALDGGEPCSANALCAFALSFSVVASSESSSVFLLIEPFARFAISYSKKVLPCSVA